MKNTIATIINKIPRGSIFDAHTIINYLIQKYTEIYLSSYNLATSLSIHHGNIAREVAKFEKSTIVKNGNSWSMNIHKKYSKCKCWRKK